MADQELYFIALLPPPDISENIRHLQYEISQRYLSKGALRSPPHITLHMPFRWSLKRKKKLVSTLARFSGGIKPVDVTLNGFGAFPPRVIYIAVMADILLDELQKQLVSCTRRELSLHNADYKDKPFTPHLTVAFRDLKKTQFRTAWSYFENQPFYAEFKATKLILLKHHGDHWKPDQRFHFLT